MKRLIPYIRQHLSLRLGLLIVLIVTVVFSLLFSYLLSRCRKFIQNAAIEHATQLLDKVLWMKQNSSPISWPLPSRAVCTLTHC